MVIGIPKEIKSDENRVAVIPFGVERLTKLGAQILIEKNAGIKSGFTDIEYIKSGATIKNNAKDYLGEVKDYFNNNVFVTNVILKRNFYSEEAKKTELYNNFYHNDAYVFTHFKLFVNLMDMNEGTGPTHVYSIAETKEIIKKSNSYKRNSLLGGLSINGIKPYKHMGKKGECFFCFTSQCLHKAGIPHKENIRDYLVITFCSYPNKSNDLFHYENEYSDQIWNGNSQLSTKLAKPYGYKKLFTLYKSFTNH